MSHRLGRTVLHWVIAASLTACGNDRRDSPSDGASGSPPNPPDVELGDGEGDGAGGSGGGTLGELDGAPPTGDFLLDAPASTAAVTLPGPELGPLADDLTNALATSADALAARHAVPHLSALSYEPLASGGLDLIAQSPLSLDPAERAVLASRGFVISPRQEFPSIAYGYASIYAADLPVFISADMLLEAVHRSYDATLLVLESNLLRLELETLLSRMRRQLAVGGVRLAPNVAADVDLYLTIADSLLAGSAQTPLTASLERRVRDIYESIAFAAGEVSVELFGVPRLVDTSQFVPRGHYAGDYELERYFRAMMWLGRTDFRLIETQPDGTQLFRPRQLQAAFALDALMDAESKAIWQRLDHSIGLFVGEHDDMTVLELGDLLAALGVSSAAELSGLPDDEVAAAIVRGKFGQQRIASRIIVKDLAKSLAGTFPLDAAFSFFGQRYTVDSHVFSNLVYDRVGQGEVLRVVPNPLDVAFAALGNDQAVSTLAPELARFDYAGDLAAVRALVDAHPVSYWQSSLYTSWLAALRSLSPTAAGSALDEAGLPEVARTEAWGHRLLNTQLASWAELRHDTLLYAKQSYTASNACEFPDAYVDPYPAFFHALGRFAEQGQSTLLELTASYPGNGTLEYLANYYQFLGEVAGRLAEMAEFQRTGQPHTPEQLDFINQAVQVQPNCDGTDILTGWYSRLFVADDALDFDPTVADVHTDPGGVLPPREPSVLHVATGNPRLMVMTRETCAGPRAYAGIVMSYFEHLAEGYTRLDDAAWKAQLMAGPPPAEVPWLADALPAPAP